MVYFPPEKDGSLERILAILDLPFLCKIKFLIILQEISSLAMLLRWRKGVNERRQKLGLNPVQNFDASFMMKK